MPLLFSYGTLQEADVQLSTFGRTLAGQEDQLDGFERSLLRVEDHSFVRASGKTHHAIVRRTGRADDKVDGTVYEITDAELASADEYEPAEYRRVAASLASGRQAWVYIDARPGGQP